MQYDIDEEVRFVINGQYDYNRSLTLNKYVDESEFILPPVRRFNIASGKEEEIVEFHFNEPGGIKFECICQKIKI